MKEKIKTLDKNNENLKLKKIAKKQKLQEQGITLIALVVTIIILLILAGVTLNIALSDNGLFGKAKKAAEDYGMAQAREKLQMTLADIELEKIKNPNFSEEDLRKKLQEAGYELDDNTVIVDDWRFEVNGDTLEVGESLGKGILNKDIKLALSEENSEDYVTSTIKATVNYSGKIKSIKIANEVVSDIQGESNIYTASKEVKTNGTYKVYVWTENEEYNTGTIQVKEITEDLTISNVEGLAKFRDEVNKGRTYEGRTVSVLSNINLNIEENWTPIGNVDHPFKGTFEGNYHQIENLNINTTENNQGFFGVNSGIIQDLVIRSGSIKAGANVGSIAGENRATIRNCGSNILVSGYAYCGGITGVSIENEAKIIGCYNSGKIETQKNSSNESAAGGIVGYSRNSNRIENCYNIGNVSGSGNYIGGIRGVIGFTNENGTSFLNCYNVGKVTSNTNVCGGFVGNINNSRTDSFGNCFCNSNPAIRGSTR